ncbi:hypothetical protein OZX67_04880 [Bifidobacterium sp. ESL0728]|uniref:hypothetical protein n=1 Tax=Bifidobacterium sp. ESL0728 TaxID=2983220 RepID=UPI0023F9327F|nr:hypothetical protein [Bifidobacterium sp. ESL0728]WEV59866.1 hypothetical protein OZX67_04880 [Bifidobacterium sp. ESL0728]
MTRKESLAYDNLNITQDTKTMDEIDTIARNVKVDDASRQAADEYCQLLDKHHAWGLCFNGYANAAGYGYVYEPTMAVAADGWDAQPQFRKLSRTAQLLVVLKSFQSGHDIDRESGRNFLKNEFGIVINDDFRFN